MGVERRTGQTVAALLLILLIGLAAYGNSFQVPFVFDDKYALVDNPDIRSLADFYAEPTRYVAYLTFALNYHFGGYAVVGYHVLNLVIHLLTALLVYVLLRLTLRTPYFAGQGAGAGDACVAPTLCRAATFIPLFAALLFVAHPIQTQAVTYIVQRMTSLTTLFYLLSMVLYVLARLSMAKAASTLNPQPSTLKPILLLVCATLSAVLAMKTKEIAFTLPLAVLLYEVFFFKGDWKRRLFYTLPLLATLPIVPMNIVGLSQLVGQQQEGISGDIGQEFFTAGDLPRTVYLFTQFRVIVTYLRLLFFPVNQNLDYDYPIYQSFVTPSVILPFLFLAGLFSLAIYLFLRTRILVQCTHQQDAHLCSPTFDPLGRLISFGILWFFLTLAVESSLVPIKDVIVEHRLYLPSVGFMVACVTAVLLLAKKFKSASAMKICLFASFLLVPVLGYATYQRNHVWGDEIRLWQDVIAKSPDKARPYNALGVALNERGRYAEAMQVLSRATVLDPAHPHAYNNLALALIKSNRSYEAIPLLKKAIALHLRYGDAHINLAAAYNQLRQFHQTVEFLEKHIGWLGERAEAHYHLGVAYAFLGERDAAMGKMMIVKKFGADDLVEDLQRLLDLER